MDRRSIAGWTGLAVLSALGVAAVVNPGSGQSVRPRAELTASTASLTQFQPARAMTAVDTMPVIEVRATRL